MKESRTIKTFRNFQYGSINKIITMILSFINRTIFIQILGVEYLGINGLFSDVLMMLSMADLGLGTAMAYSFYKPLAENDEKKLGLLISFYKKIYNIIALSVAIIGISIIPFLEYLINLEKPVPFLKIYYLFFLANTVISYLFVYKGSIISADQKNYMISKYQLYVSVIKSILQSIFLIVMENYFAYLIIQLIATLTNNIIISKKSDELYPYIRDSGHKIDSSEKKNILDNFKSVFIYKVSGVLLNGTDNTLISIMVGTLWVGIYSNYNLIINSINSFIGIIYTSVTASIGNVVATEKPKQRFEVFNSMQTISLLITTFTTVCLYVLLNDLMYVWLGSQYVINNLILNSIMINFYIAGVLRPIWTYREVTGLYNKTKYIMLIAAIENIFLSILMGKFMGMAGILYASAISRLSTYFWYEPKLLFKEYFNEGVYNYYMQLLRNFLITTVLIITINMLLKGFLIDSWLKLIIKTIIVAFLTLVAEIIIYNNTSGYRMIVKRIQGLIKNT